MRHLWSFILGLSVMAALFCVGVILYGIGVLTFNTPVAGFVIGLVCLFAWFTGELIQDWMDYYK